MRDDRNERGGERVAGRDRGSREDWHLGRGNDDRWGRTREGYGGGQGRSGSRYSEDFPNEEQWSRPGTGESLSDTGYRGRSSFAEPNRFDEFEDYGYSGGSQGRAGRTGERAMGGGMSDRYGRGGGDRGWQGGERGSHQDRERGSGSMGGSWGAGGPRESRDWGESGDRDFGSSRGGDRGYGGYGGDRNFGSSWGGGLDRGPHENDWRGAGAGASFGWNDRDRDRDRERFPQSGPHAGRGPKNYQRSDDRLTEDVCDRLMEHPMIDASDIEVKVQGGEVTLRGTVDDRRVKHRIEDLVDGIMGVREVHNELKVRREGGNLGRFESHGREGQQGSQGSVGSVGGSTSTIGRYPDQTTLPGQAPVPGQNPPGHSGGSAELAGASGSLHDRGTATGDTGGAGTGLAGEQPASRVSPAGSPGEGTRGRGNRKD